MFYPPELLSWVDAVSSHLPHLSHSQARTLAWYSFAASVVQGGISQVSYFLACLLDQDENTLRQRLRESLYDADDKRGAKRQALVVVDCFLPLLSWVLSQYESADDTVVLILDATTLRQTFTVLTLAIVVGHCALPVAWVVLPATQPGAWRPHWLRLLASLDTPLLARFDRVLVLADRGLYAKWLFEAIVAQGWHPLLRINARGSCCLHATGQRLALATLATLCRHRLWQGPVTCFLDERQLRCTLLVLWDDAQTDAWLLVTDLLPGQGAAAWYALRMAVEFGFKLYKSAGLHWERTRMTDPGRAARLWLVLALACWRNLLLAPPVDLAPASLPPYPRLSLFRQGWLRQLALLFRRCPLSSSPLRLPPLPPSPLLDFLATLDTYP